MTNAQRAEIAYRCALVYAQETGGTFDGETTPVDLMADLLHYVREWGGDDAPLDAHGRAWRHYEAKAANEEEEV